MTIEYEATFEHVDKEAVRARLRSVGAERVRESFLQKRVVFNLPKGHEREGAWLRVRDEGDKITCCLKQVSGSGIEDQKELEITVSDFETAVAILEMAGSEKKAYQETRRELWRLDGVDVTIDEWPWLEPIVEVEGASEEVVRVTAETLGFDWEKALFCAADELYVRAYGITKDQINNHTPNLVFEGECPFN